ncbi:MAG: hypothetical protein ACE5E5_15285 [Phycisphaerae bacterium]
MILFNNTFGNLPRLCIVIGLAAVTALTMRAAVAWWSVRRATACRPHIEEHRAWTYCPKCGWSRPADESGSSSDTPTRPIRDAITVAHTLTANTRLLPSDLLRRGWTRAAAIDAEGRIVTPCDSTATAYSIWGAGNRAFDPDGKVWREWNRHLTEILAERYGGTNACRWNREAGRTHSEVLALAVEIELRMGL